VAYLREWIMNHTFSSRVLFLLTFAACGGKVDVGYDHPLASGSGGASSTSAGSAGATSGGAGSSTTSTTGSGGGGATGSPQNDLSTCQADPARAVTYTTLEQLDTLLVRRWQRCLAPQLDGEDVGVEFTADGHYYPLTRDAANAVVRLDGVRHTGTWAYYPAGSVSPISHQPSATAWIELTGVGTSPPSFTEEPVQMGILFSPVPSRYIPLDP
jgi:hypothetical protein